MCTICILYVSEGAIVCVQRYACRLPLIKILSMELTKRISIYIIYLFFSCKCLLANVVLELA